MNKQAIAQTQTEYVHMATDKLLATVKNNRQGHLNQWEEAHEKWRERQVEKMVEFKKELEKAISAAQEGRVTKWPVQNAYVLREPRNHVKEYDRTIRRLEMTIDKEMYLTLNDFDRYVMDEWSWKGEFAATNSAYIGAAS